MMKTLVVTLLGLVISTFGSCSTDCGLNMLSECATEQSQVERANDGNEDLVDVACSGDRASE